MPRTESKDPSPEDEGAACFGLQSPQSLEAWLAYLAYSRNEMKYSYRDKQNFIYFDDTHHIQYLMHIQSQNGHAEKCDLQTTYPSALDF